MEFPDTKQKTDLNSKEDNLPPKFYANERWMNNLNLRKKKLQEIISKRRDIERFKKDGNKDYELIKENLKIETEIKNKLYEDVESFMKEMKKYIKMEDKEYNKYALYCIRNQINNNDNSNNKIYLTEELYKKDFISDILILFQKYFDDKQIIFEGLWIFINIIYFLKDNTDLSMFLTNKNCINLYLKILDKKDNCLRFHIYWLVSNLLCNDKYNVVIEVLFHLYMSPFFRLYIFKTLEDGEQITENEVKIIFNILCVLSNFINETFICLRNNKIQHFIDYNSEVDFNSIQENNNFLFYHSLKQFLLNVENSKLKFFCFYGLAKLSNFLADQYAYNEFFKSGLCRKLVTEQIQSDEDSIIFIVQIIGNFLSCSKDEYIDLIFLDEILSFFIKVLQNNPQRQMLRRDIFWSASNITSGSPTFCEKFASSGMLQLTLQSIYTDNDFTIYEALYCLMGFLDRQNNFEVVVKYHYFDYAKNLFLCLKNMKSRTNPGEKYINMELINRIFLCIGILFEVGEVLKGNMKNKFVEDFDKCGGFEMIENFLSENNLDEQTQNIGEELLQCRNN